MNSTRIRRAVLLGVLSVIVLAAQVSLTRLFSVIFWYHFGFLIISTSLLGFGIGGLVIRAMRERLEQIDADRVVTFGTAASGPLLALALTIITHNPFRPLAVHQSATDLLLLVAVSAAMLLPFVAMGATVLFILQRWSDSVDWLYGANLLGSGFGCLVAILLLDRFGGRTAYLLLAASLPLLAAWYAAPRSMRDSMIAAGLTLALLGTLAGAQTFYPLDTASKRIACLKDSQLVFTDWTSLSKVDICSGDQGNAASQGLWGLSQNNTHPLPTRLGVVIDYWAYTTILEHSEKPGYYDFLDALPMYMAYHWTDEPSVLTIGAGGGMDVRAALEGGASEVDAVEINPSIFRAMTEDLSEYSGRIYRHPKVRSHLAEGRRFVESADRKWDVIQISGVDTHSATQAGAFALAENFLYTTEAMQTYLNHLEDDGILTLTRWYFPTEGKPRFSMRLFSLVVESLLEAGVEDPARHMVFFKSKHFTVLLLKKKPITGAEVAAVDAKVKQYGYEFIHRPDRPVASDEFAIFREFLHSPDRDAFREAYPYDISPPTDDRPFFFEHRKLRDIYKTKRFIGAEGLDGQMILAFLLFEMLIAGLALTWVSYRIEDVSPRPIGWLYFGAIGLGFMLVEVTLTQRLVLFLGHPVYALTIVLFTLLVSSGVGSALSSRIARSVPVPKLLFGVAAVMVGWALVGTPVLRMFIGAPTAIRVLVGVAMIAPAGVLMGTAFPEAVRRLANSNESELGVYWAWNGVASVTASVLAVIVAMTSGFATVMWIAAAAYLGAGLVLPKLGPASD